MEFFRTISQVGLLRPRSIIQERIDSLEEETGILDLCPRALQNFPTKFLFIQESRIFLFFGIEDSGAV
jgi:hypothetical protein